MSDTDNLRHHRRSRLTLYLVPSIMSVVRIHKRAHSRATHATGCPVCFLTGTPESTPVQIWCIYGRPESSPVCQGTDNDSGVAVTKPTRRHVVCESSVGYEQKSPVHARCLERSRFWRSRHKANMASCSIWQKVASGLLPRKIFISSQHAS